MFAGDGAGYLRGMSEDNPDRNRNKKTVREYRKRWFAIIVVLIAVVIGCVVVLVLVRQGEIDRSPWGFMALAAAILAAFSAALVTFLEAAFEPDPPDEMPGDRDA